MSGAASATATIFRSGRTLRTWAICELRLQRRLAGFRPKTERFQTIVFRVLETDRPAGRLAGPWLPAPFPSGDCPSFPTSARLDDGLMPPSSPKSLAVSRGVQWSRTRRAAAGFIRQPLSIGENNSLRVRKYSTGKHGNWLNIAENELRIRQCLCHHRLGDLETLQAEISAWSVDVNERQRGADWES